MYTIKSRLFKNHGIYSNWTASTSDYNEATVSATQLIILVTDGHSNGKHNGLTGFR